MEKKEILIYDNGICIGLYPVEKILYDSYPIIIYGDVVIFDNDPPVSVIFFADVEYGMIAGDNLIEPFFTHENVVTPAELKSALQIKSQTQCVMGIDLANGPDFSSRPSSEYLSRFAKANNMSIDDAKEQAICKECLKSYKEVE
ncbi:hypothetical protein [Bacteroides sp.]|uniref:hypothetical protein n=1 Tax=Bacteroides sp. TaxID=29523 RepID=UPI002608E506|nr:hypothetical protein [Bacteroides sp.]MDD3040039.1 hypothetical protein [Bacteroides sp.]